MTGDSLSRPKCLIVADDLTGACDSAVHFAAAGARTLVPVRGGRDGSFDVLAVSTESRDLDPAEARGRIAEMAASLAPLGAAILFKKIDSTLRGNTFIEIAAAADAFRCDAVVVNPAFPALGRVVEDGALRVVGDSSFPPVDVVAGLRGCGANPCRHVAPGMIAEAITAGARFVSLDAACEADLVCIADEVLALDRRVLWAGSGGLAMALATRLHGGSAPVLPAADDSPVLFCLGSEHPVTLAQQARLLAERSAAMLDAVSAVAAEVLAIFHQGRHLVLRAPRGRVAAESLRLLISDCRPAAALVSGGDTVSLFCHALEVDAIELRRELAPGIPAGVIRGGAWDGAVVATKSGGFGLPGDLLDVADWFQPDSAPRRGAHRATGN